MSIASVGGPEVPVVPPITPRGIRCVVMHCHWALFESFRASDRTVPVDVIIDRPNLLGIRYLPGVVLLGFFDLELELRLFAISRKAESERPKNM